MTTDVASQPEEPEEPVEVLLPNTNIVTHCVLKNDVERLRKSFEDDEDPYKETVADLINFRGRDGKSPLDLTSTLGRIELAKELILRGAEVNSANIKGIFFICDHIYIYNLCDWVLFVEGNIPMF